MTPEEIYRRMGENLGLRIVKSATSTHRAYTFTGKTIQPDGFASSWFADVAHELGHYFAASPERRGIPEWGFGYTYEPLSGDPPDMIKSPTLAQEEECVASIVGILLQRAVEGHKAALDTWGEHNWFESGWAYAMGFLRTPNGASALREMRECFYEATRPTDRRSTKEKK